jgi:hypothetical protein
VSKQAWDWLSARLKVVAEESKVRLRVEDGMMKKRQVADRLAETEELKGGLTLRAMRTSVAVKNDIRKVKFVRNPFLLC